jgi:predicted metal-dependent phosphoesterase TrpH
VTSPEYLFGIEVLNTHPRHDSRNDIALAWAEKYDLHKIAGSDCHQTEDVGSSAILTDYPVKNMNDLVYVLKNDLYTFGVNPQ